MNCMLETYIILLANVTPMNIIKQRNKNEKANKVNTDGGKTKVLM